MLSSSSASDECSSPEVGSKSKQESKKIRTDGDSEDMAVQETLNELKEAMSKLATKEDVQELKSEIHQLREDMEKMKSSLTDKIEVLESTVFDLQKEKDELRAQISKLQGEKSEMQGQLAQGTREAVNIRRVLNDNEQHGRSWNLRVFGIREQGEETLV